MFLEGKTFRQNSLGKASKSRSKATRSLPDGFKLRLKIPPKRVFSFGSFSLDKQRK
jgi:hypothetical protein